jgi:hypothetical protein
MLLLVSFSTNAAIWAQTPTSAENSLLWEITGPGLKTPSYLFGTIHMIPAEDFALNAATRQAFETAKTITFEIDTEEMSNPMALFSMMGKMYMANDTSLSDLLSKEEYQLVADHFDNIGMPLSFLRRIKPMFLSVMVSEDMKNFQSGQGDKIMSYELELTRMAKEAEKDIRGLETMEYQMGLFDSIPYLAQARMLVDAVKAEQALKNGETENDDLSFDRMVELYKNQDIIAMQELGGEEEGLAGYEDILLNNRNRNWISGMVQQMKEGATFFAVGAGHLAGEVGVIALLRAEGYQLKPLRGE